MSALPDRIKNRKIVQWTLAYSAAAWFLYEALSLISQNFGLAPTFIRVLTILLAMGLPVAVVLAWYHGEKGQQRVTAIELSILSALLLIGATGMTLVIKPRVGSTRDAHTTVRGAPPQRIDPKSVAVLPLSSLSDDPKDGYFAAGMQDEILTQLSKLHDLKVISRTSVMQYREGTRNLRQIGQDLGVAAVLEGSVLRAGDKVRITVQLINAATDEHIWADDYDGTLTDVIAIQDSVARAIAASLQARLSPAESARLKEVATSNAAAYDEYLRGLAYEHLPPTRENLSLAEASFKRAVAADANSAAAYAHLSHIESSFYWYAFDRTAARLAQSKRYIERAAALKPELADVHFSAGYYYYWVQRDYARAHAEFSKVLESSPNDAEALAALAFIARRSGDWQGAIARMVQASTLDPRNVDLLRNLGNSYDMVRDHANAARTLGQTLAIVPDFNDVIVARANVFLRWKGLTDSLRLALQRVPASYEPTVSLIPVAPRVKLAMYERRYDDALRAAQASAAVLEHQRQMTTRNLLQALAYEAMGRIVQARSQYDSARVVLEQRLQSHPDDPRVYAALGRVYAALGRAGDAIRMGQRAVELMPSNRDALDGPAYATQLAIIYARTGHAQEAVRLLSQLLRTPAGPAVKEISLDPEWDPIRNDPGFKALLHS